MNASDHSAAPLITTIIPTYRRPLLVERAINSVLRQTWSHVRVCVYDNASGDDTGERVRKLAASDPRVRYFCHAENIGACRNFIHGMDRVDTPFFSLLSDDDLLLPQLYENAMAGFRRCPEAILSVATNLRMEPDGTVVGAPLTDWKTGLYNPPHGFVTMLERGHPDWASVVFRREVLQLAGGLDEETWPGSDYDYLLRVAARFPIVVSTDPGSIFVVHRGSISANPIVHTASGWLKIIENHTGSGQLPPHAVEYARKVMTNALVQTIFMTHGIYAILVKRWRDSHEAACVLRRDYGLWMRASVLDTMSWACEYLPFVHRLFMGLNVVRRFLTKIKRRPLQRRFGNYATYLGDLR